MLTQKEIEFIIENAKADTTKLLLAAKRYPDINVKLCISCIESRKKLASKLPDWYAKHTLVYPFPLSAEQCSSEATGQYKKHLMATILKNKSHNAPTETLSSQSETGEPLLTEPATTSIRTINGADLTGGMGVDSYYLSGLCKGKGKFHYFERNSELCKATQYNFKQLGADNIEVCNAELTKENIAQLLPEGLDFIFIDPARRSKSDKSAKVISLDEYEPNLIELQEELFRHTPTILAKVSPMADIKLNLNLLPETTGIDIVSVDNECKEVLFLLERRGSKEQFKKISDIPITAVNIRSKKGSNFHDCIMDTFTFTFAQEEEAAITFAGKIGKYLYEPNKSLLKSGAFKLPCERYGIEKLAASTHLYTSDLLLEEFPGKIYSVEESIPFSKKSIKAVASKYPKADLTARNFPLDTNAVKKLSGIKDGGEKHIFATTLNSGEKIIIIASLRK